MAINTCLSVQVHHMVCNLGLEKVDSVDLERIVTVSGQVCWEAITFYLRTLDTGSYFRVLQLI